MTACEWGGPPYTVQHHMKFVLLGKPGTAKNWATFTDTAQVCVRRRAALASRTWKKTYFSHITFTTFLFQHLALDKNDPTDRPEPVCGTRKVWLEQQTVICYLSSTFATTAAAWPTGGVIFRIDGLYLLPVCLWIPWFQSLLPILQDTLL